MLPTQNDVAQTPSLSGSVPLVRMFVNWQLISPIDLAHTQTGGLRVASGVTVDFGRLWSHGTWILGTLRCKGYWIFVATWKWGGIRRIVLHLILLRFSFLKIYQFLTVYLRKIRKILVLYLFLIRLRLNFSSLRFLLQSRVLIVRLFRNEWKFSLRLTFILNDNVRPYSWRWLHGGHILGGFTEWPKTCAQTLRGLAYIPWMISCSESGIREFPRETRDLTNRIALVRVEGHIGWAISSYVWGAPIIGVWEEPDWKLAWVGLVHLSGEERIGDVKCDLGARNLLLLVLMRCLHLSLLLEDGLLAWRVAAIVLTENETTVKRGTLKVMNVLIKLHLILLINHLLWVLNRRFLAIYLYFFSSAFASDYGCMQVILAHLIDFLRSFISDLALWPLVTI